MGNSQPKKKATSGPGPQQPPKFQEWKFVVLGAGAVGKSALSLQFVKGEFIQDYDPTIEDSYRKELDVDGGKVSLEIVDTAGQEEFHAMRDQWIINGQGFILVFSLTDRESFSELMPLYKKILDIKGVSKVPVVVVGNKMDLQDKRVQHKEGQDLAKAMNNASFVETSAKTNTNVDACFMQLVRDCRTLDPK